MNPDTWVASARRGDARAFERLVTHYESGAYHLALRQLGDPDEALDACQDAVLSAWRAIRRFDGDGEAFRRWLYRIVVNACRDRARYEARRPRRPLEGDDDGSGAALPLPDPGQTPESYAENADLRALLEACLARLSEEHRTVVVLDQLGLDYAEIAEVVGVEVGTVKSRLSRARARLREMLTGEPGTGAAEPDASGARSKDGTPLVPLRRAPGPDAGGGRPEGP